MRTVHHARGLQRTGLALLLVGVGFAEPARAQIVAPAGRTLFNRAVLVRSLVRLDTFDTSESGDDLRRQRVVNAVVWGPRPHTSLSFVIPMMRVERGGPGREVTETGTGDAAVFARYDILRRTVPGGYTRLAPEVGVKLPTGGRFGSGSTDLIAGLVFSHVRDPDWWIADVQLTAPGTGDGGVRAGQRQRADLAYLRRVFPRRTMGVPMALVVLELNGEMVDRSTRDGIEMPSSGGDLLFFSPGFEYVVRRQLVLEASVPIPIVKRLHGAQPEPEGSFILGVRWLF